ncbi:MAG: 1-acyl-sn-glycerol-3-phosphate acyltransferase [Acidobacteriaceae bacterium]|jgi:1-acyl-sn-glycerol-3-phosphate acyltransferase|nr:1-acyl-sn-glycerol-3-phosphate acyltransferase [Acidobacteriaceae bacterium]
MSSGGMSSTPGAQPALSLTSRLTSNLARGPLFFLFTGVFGCMSLAASCLEKDGRLQHNIARQWARTSLRIAGAPVTVIGRENLLPVAVYTSNHTSFMDTPLVFSSLPFQFRILAKQSLWKWPFIGWHLQRSGQIPVDEESGSGSVAGLNRAIRVLKSGMPLFIFPEGGRTKDGQVKSFMRGPAYISIRARVPLVPMALIGTFELLPIHTHHFRPRPVKLVIGKPIDPSGYSIRQADELTARLRDEILHLYESHAAPGDLSPSLAAPSVDVVREDV